MSLTDFTAPVDDKLREVFHRKAYDPTRDRAAIMRRLDTAHDQFRGADASKARRIFKIRNDVVELTLPFPIAGKSVFHLPVDRFSDDRASEGGDRRG